MSSLDLKRGILLGRPRAFVIPISGTLSGPIFALRRLLGPGSSLSLAAGTNGNLTLSGTTIVAAVSLGTATQVAVVREARGFLAIEYSISFVGMLPATPTISFGQAIVSAEEGSAATFPLLLDRRGVSGAISGTWAVTPGSSGSPAAASDFPGGVFPSGTFTVAAGSDATAIVVSSAEDSTAEPNEDYILTATLGAFSVTSTGIILNDDAANASLPDGQWGVPYNAAITTSAADGSAVAGLPRGLTGSVAGGILTITGTPY